MQPVAAKQPDLDLHGIGGVVLVQQMTEVQNAGRGGRLPLQGPVPLTLIRPSPIQSPVLPEDVRTEFASRCCPPFGVSVWASLLVSVWG